MMSLLSDLESGIYQHYKGGYYLLIGLAEHTETKELMVIYVSLDASLPGPRLRCRPLEGPEGWSSKVHWTLQDVKPRFVYVGHEIRR